MSLQLARDGRRILWLAHESAPKNFTGVDVTNPRTPRVIIQTKLPHRNVRSNSLEVCGDLMAVAYQTSTHGMTPAGIEMFDISTPEQPRSVSFFDCSGPASRGVHQLWFVDGKTVHFAGGAPDFTPLNLLDDQCYRSIDVSNPSHPTELGRWWYPGTCTSDDAPPPPFPGFTHTVMPLFGRGLLVVSDECVHDDGLDWPKLVWLLDARIENKPVCIGTLPLPPIEDHAYRGGRYGAHNLHENRPGPSFKSETLLFGTYFNGGVRVHDLANPLQPHEVALYVPETPATSTARSIQINDVYVDDNRTTY